MTAEHTVGSTPGDVYARVGVAAQPGDIAHRYIVAAVGVVIQRTAGRVDDLQLCSVAGDREGPEMARRRALDIIGPSILGDML